MAENPNKGIPAPDAPKAEQSRRDFLKNAGFAWVAFSTASILGGDEAQAGKGKDKKGKKRKKRKEEKEPEEPVEGTSIEVDDAPGGESRMHSKERNTGPVFFSKDTEQTAEVDVARDFQYVTDLNIQELPSQCACGCGGGAIDTGHYALRGQSAIGHICPSDTSRFVRYRRGVPYRRHSINLGPGRTGRFPFPASTRYNNNAQQRWFRWFRRY